MQVAQQMIPRRPIWWRSPDYVVLEDLYLALPNGAIQIFRAPWRGGGR